MGIPTKSRPIVSSKPVLQTLQDAEELQGHRVNTGIPGLNRVLGRNRHGRGPFGLHVPSCILFGGAQGCGKTTLLLMALALMREREILLLSTEQTLGEIKTSLVGIGLGQYAGRIPACSLLDYDCLLEKADAIIRALDPRIVVIDSINDLRDDTVRSRDHLSRRVALIRHFKADAEQNNRAIIMTAHLTKSDSVAGKREQLHVASTVMMIKKEDEKRRVLYCPDKNRFGDISEKAYFEMGQNGLIEVSENADEPVVSILS
jgi:predicted ATP-dependent serine protease